MTKLLGILRKFGKFGGGIAGEGRQD